MEPVRRSLRHGGDLAAGTGRASAALFLQLALPCRPEQRTAGNSAEEEKKQQPQSPIKREQTLASAEL